MTSALATQTLANSSAVSFVTLQGDYRLAIIKDGGLYTQDDEPIDLFKTLKKSKDGSMKPVFFVPNCRLDEIQIDTIGSFNQDKLQVAVTCINPQDGSLERLCLGAGVTTQSAINLVAALSGLVQNNRVTDEFDFCFARGYNKKVTLASCQVHNLYNPNSVVKYKPTSWLADTRVYDVFKQFPKVKDANGFRVWEDPDAVKQAMILIIQNIRTALTSSINNSNSEFAVVPVSPISSEVVGE